MNTVYPELLLPLDFTSLIIAEKTQNFHSICSGEKNLSFFKISVMDGQSVTDRKYVKDNFSKHTQGTRQSVLL